MGVVAGLDSTKVSKPLDFICAGMDDEAWKVARLRLVHALIQSNTVDSVSKLHLDIKQNLIVHVDFKGKRRSQYSGTAPHEIEISENIQRK